MKEGLKNEAFSFSIAQDYLQSFLNSSATNWTFGPIMTWTEFFAGRRTPFTPALLIFFSSTAKRSLTSRRRRVIQLSTTATFPAHVQIPVVLEYNLLFPAFAQSNLPQFGNHFEINSPALSIGKQFQTNQLCSHSQTVGITLKLLLVPVILKPKLLLSPKLICKFYGFLQKKYYIF